MQWWVSLLTVVLMVSIKPWADKLTSAEFWQRYYEKKERRRNQELLARFTRRQ